jgi:PKD repeat protein
MKYLYASIISLSLLLIAFPLHAQDSIVGPKYIITGTFLGETPPLRDLPAVTDEEFAEMELRAKQKMLNPGLQNRSYPYAATALPKGPDPVWQREMGTTTGSRAPIMNFQGQATTIYYPPDPNGTAGPNHYMQTINATYAIYTKTGTLLAGPTNLNTLFNGVTGSQYNNGDPIILYDAQADRWFVAEFSISGTNDYMLMAVSTSNDPTGTWYAYSFDVADMPDYMKFGVWQDGYYMSTNNAGSYDIYVFERSQMLIGGTAQGVGFDNPNRPGTIDNFCIVPPLDNDGTWAPAGSPGLFIGINDDAIGGGADEIWIYELDADWTTPANSTFARVQQISVASFDSHFGTNWDNIKQPNTTRELDAIPMIIMNPPQYRNFGSYRTIVCCHTVDVDNTDHAGIRWYELQKTSSTWVIRQQGTFAPDEHSRWMGSIQMNANHEIGLAYSISSTTVYPGIRYCGQTSTANSAATNSLDVTEDVIHTGSNSQTAYNRWGDYSSLQLDPADDETFWYTNEYITSTGARGTKIASFQIGPAIVVSNFSASNTSPLPGVQVNFTDQSTGTPNSWTWTFTPNTVTCLNGTSASSQNPQVSFDAAGYYTVSLYATNGESSDTETKTNYIYVYTPGQWAGTNSPNWNDPANWDGGILPTGEMNVIIPSTAPAWPVFTGNFVVGSQCSNLTFNTNSQLTVTGNFTVNTSKTLNMTGGGTLSLGGNWLNNGAFVPGVGTVEFIGPGNSSVTAPATGISNYSLTTFDPGMTAIPSTYQGPSGNDGESVIPIGFTFSLDGNSYTNLKMCTNGWLSLDQSGTAASVNNANLFTSTLPNTSLAPWWDDLKDDESGHLCYITQGTSPNRIFTAEWNQILTYKNVANARISFQIKLYEGTDVIEFHYGTLSAGNHNNSESASIGIEDATGGSGHFIEATTGSTTSGVTTLKSETQWPTLNYRFTPPAPQATFNNLVINNPGDTLTFDINTILNGNLTVMPGANFNVPANKTLNINANQ